MIGTQNKRAYWQQRAEAAEATVLELQGVLPRFEALAAQVAQMQQVLEKAQSENFVLREAHDSLAVEVATLRAENATLRAENAALRERNEELTVLVAGLQRQLFGRKTEKMPPVEKEIRDQEGRPADPEKAARRRKKNAQTRKELPTEEVLHPLPEEKKVCPKCGGTDFRKLPTGEETSEYEYRPARVVRRVHTQEKWACRCGECILTAEGPTKVWEGASYGPGLVAQVVTAKCVDSIPLYRQEKQFKRLGIPMARATLVFLFHRCANVLAPIWRALQEYVTSQDLVQADETPMPTQEKKKGYIWTFLTDLAILYVFSMSRSGETPCQVLGGKTGTLVVDAYSGYNRITTPDGWTRAGCLAHVRRKFFEAITYCPDAQQAMDLIREVYRVEHQARERGLVGTAAHLLLRQQHTRPIMDRFHEWLDGQNGRYPPKTPMAKAVSYALSHWKELTEFLSDARLPPDNNRSESALRIAALGRKNFLFIGHEEAGRNLAGLYSLVMTCEANGVNPQQYLADVLIRVQSHPDSRVQELLPHNWKVLFGQPPPPPA